MIGYQSILIVDDNYTNIKLLESYLATHDGYVIYTATNGLEALNVLFHNDISLVLSDLVMPVMDGFELLDIIKHIKKTKDIPVVIISSQEQEEISKSELLNSAECYIQKPVKREELMNIIKKILN